MARRTKIAILIVVIAAGSLVAAITSITTFHTPGPSPSPSPSAPSAIGNGGVLNLPRIAWEGGPAYWDQFSVTKAAGWNNPSFFPIVIWYDSVSSGAEVRADESYGINTYTGENASTNYYFYADNKAFTLDSLDNAPADGTAQPGLFIADEPDGRTTSANDLNTIKKLVASSPYNGRFKEINFSNTVISGSAPAVNEANFDAMVNSYAGPVSVDKYYYTQPSCFDIRYMILPIDPDHCRTSSSYGATVRAVRARLAADGRLKPVWNFIENLSGAPDPDHFYAYIRPGQLGGAVMDSIINEARGIIYFNQSFAGACQGGNVIRQVQIGALPCASPQMNAMKEVDQRIKVLAPVINTQSYEYSFGTNLDTMLKAYRGSAYIFAMISGAASSEPGNRTFALPPRLAHATSVQVLNENRIIPVVNGKFTDNFAHEYTYHIYKVAISGK
jgi:hypothetical protein